MKENTFSRGESSVTIRLADDKCLHEFLHIMRGLTRFGSGAYNGNCDFWTTEGWKTVDVDSGNDVVLENEVKTFSVKVSWNNTFYLKRPEKEWTVGGLKLTENKSMETEVSTTKYIIDAVKAVAGIVFGEVEIVETDGPCDPSKWEEI